MKVSPGAVWMTAAGTALLVGSVYLACQTTTEASDRESLSLSVPDDPTPNSSSVPAPPPPPGTPASGTKFVLAYEATPYGNRVVMLPPSPGEGDFSEAALSYFYV